MIENVLRHLGGVGIYGIVSVCLFFAFFTAMLFWAFRLKKSYLHAMHSLPLDAESGAEPANRACCETRPEKPATSNSL